MAQVFELVGGSESIGERPVRGQELTDNLTFNGASRVYQRDISHKQLWHIPERWLMPNGHR